MINNANDDPTTIVIFTDGSRRKSHGKRRAGAGFVMYYMGNPIHRGQLGLGRRSGVFNAEMVALASAIASSRNILPAYPIAKHILLLTDNQAALRAIDDLSDHPSQCASIIFRRHLDQLLSMDNNFRITLSWVPGHEGFTGNEEADRLAKEAASAGPPLFKSTIS